MEPQLITDGGFEFESIDIGILKHNPRNDSYSQYPIKYKNDESYKSEMTNVLFNGVNIEIAGDIDTTGTFNVIQEILMCDCNILRLEISFLDKNIDTIENVCNKNSLLYFTFIMEMLKTATYRFEDYSDFYVVKTLYTYTETRTRHHVYQPETENIVLVIRHNPLLQQPGQVDIITNLIPQITISLDCKTIFADCKRLLLNSSHPYTEIFTYIEDNTTIFDRFKVAKSYVKYLVFTCLSWVSCVEEFIKNNGENEEESSPFLKACMTFALRHSVVEVLSFFFKLELNQTNINTLNKSKAEILKVVTMIVLNHPSSTKITNIILKALFSNNYHKNLGIQKLPIKDGKFLIEYRGFVKNRLWENFILQYRAFGIIQMQEQQIPKQQKPKKKKQKNIRGSPVASLGNDIVIDDDNDTDDDNDITFDDDNDNTGLGKRLHNSGGSLRRKQKNKNKSRIKKSKSNRRTRRRHN